MSFSSILVPGNGGWQVNPNLLPATGSVVAGNNITVTGTPQTISTVPKSLRSDYAPQYNTPQFASPASVLTFTMGSVEGETTYQQLSIAEGVFAGLTNAANYAGFAQLTIAGLGQLTTVGNPPAPGTSDMPQLWITYQLRDYQTGKTVGQCVYNIQEAWQTAVSPPGTTNYKLNLNASMPVPLGLTGNTVPNPQLVLFAKVSWTENTGGTFLAGLAMGGSGATAVSGYINGVWWSLPA